MTKKKVDEIIKKMWDIKLTCPSDMPLSIYDGHVAWLLGFEGAYNKEKLIEIIKYVKEELKEDPKDFYMSHKFERFLEARPYYSREEMEEILGFSEEEKYLNKVLEEIGYEVNKNLRWKPE